MHCGVRGAQPRLLPQYVCAFSAVIRARYKSDPAESAPCLMLYCADASARATTCDFLYSAMCSWIKCMSAVSVRSPVNSSKWLGSPSLYMRTVG